jgi:hypothetical protein
VDVLTTMPCRQGDSRTIVHFGKFLQKYIAQNSGYFFHTKVVRSVWQKIVWAKV